MKIDETWHSYKYKHNNLHGQILSKVTIYIYNIYIKSYCNEIRHSILISINISTSRYPIRSLYIYITYYINSYSNKSK